MKNIIDIKPVNVVEHEVVNYKQLTITFKKECDLRAGQLISNSTGLIFLIDKTYKNKKKFSLLSVGLTHGQTEHFKKGDIAISCGFNVRLS